MYLAAGQEPKPDPEPAEKKADPPPAAKPEIKPVAGTLTTNPNGSFALAVGTGGGLVSADTKEAMAVLDEIVRIENELAEYEIDQLLARLEQDHKVAFRVDVEAFRRLGNENVLKQKPTVRARPTGMTVAATLRAAFGMEGNNGSDVTGIGFKVNGRAIEIVPSLMARGIPNPLYGGPSVTMAVENEPLGAVLARLRKHTSATIVLDERAKGQVEQPVSGVFNDAKLYTVLTLFGNMCELSLVVVDNVYYLTTAANAARLEAELGGRRAKK